MKKYYVLLFAICGLAFFSDAQQAVPKKNPLGGFDTAQRQAGTFTYSLTVLTEPYTDLTSPVSLNNGEVWDDPVYEMPLEFPFMLNGNPVTSLKIAGVGALLISPALSPDVTVAVAPFEADLIDRGAITGISESPISYQVEGDPGSRIQKLEWKNAGSFQEAFEGGTTNMFVNVQLWLYEGTNVIEFRYGPNFIDNPTVFYQGEGGAIIGLTDLNIVTLEFINPHFLEGPAAAPSLTQAFVPIDGTPTEGLVYRLSQQLPLEIEVTGQNANSFCAPNGTASVEATGGVEPYSYAWSNGETTPTIQNLDEGTYDVTVTDDIGQTAEESITITNVDPMTLMITHTNETAPGANDGTATVFPEGGLEPYTYEWSGGSTEQMVTGLAPGTYTVTVTDDAGCTAWESVTIESFECTTLTYSYAVQSASCFGACDGLIDGEVLGGTEPYTFLWSDGSTGTSLTGCAGDYGVTITDANNCTFIEAFTIAEPTQILANLTVSAESGPGANDGIAAASPSGGAPPYTYLWSNGGMESTITGLSAGTFAVTITDATNCSIIDSIQVPLTSCALEVTVTNLSCFESCDGSIQAALVNGVEPITYTWSNGADTSFIDGLCAGNYVLMAMDANGCGFTDTILVTEPDQIMANVGSTAETIAGDDGSAWAAPAGGVPPFSYAWSNGATDSLIVNLEPGIYDVTITDDSGCSISESVLVDGFVCFEVNTTIQDNVCPGDCGGSVAVAITGGTGPFQFVWGSGQTTDTIIGLCTGIYQVTITDIGQGCEAEFSYIIQEPEALLITIDTIIHVTDTTSGAVGITITGGTPPYLHQWLHDSGTIISEDEDLSDAIAGYYQIGIADANGCLAFIDSVEVRDETTGTIRIEGVTFDVFPNPVRDALQITVDQSVDYKVHLVNAEGRIIFTGTNSTRIDVQSFAPGTYFVQVLTDRGRAVERIVIFK